MGNKLKPCPFCGGEAFVATIEHSKESRPNGYRFHGQIMCLRCQATAGTTGFDSTYEEATRKAIATWSTRRERENPQPLILHFGEGKIGVGTCHPEESETWNELLLWNPRMQQAIGNQIPIAEGTTTDDLEVYARLFFHNAESAQVVADALSRIINSYGQNNTLTNADRIRSMTDEELAEFLEGDYGNFKAGRALEWLRQPAEDRP